MKKESAWQKYKKNIGETRPWHLINLENYVSEEISNKRYSICLDCPELVNFTKQCNKCGCFMYAKTKLKQATCPIGKW